jgi:hypothetical protein
MTPSIIHAFLGDTIAINASVYYASNLPFTNTDWDIDAVALFLPALGTEIAGTLSGNQVGVVIPSDHFTEPGAFNFYLRLSNSATGTVFTVLSGTVFIAALPK